MSTKAERELLKGAYPRSLTWKDKVNQMTESQVVAVYMRLRREGKL